MDNCLKICDNYAQRIGNEVGWVEQIIKDGIISINNRATPQGKVPLLYLNSQAYHSVNRMQIVYLVNLFESFMQDFIGVKEGLNDTDMSEKDFWKNYLSEIRSNWDSYCQVETKAINTSTSFMNLRYSLFVLKQKYSIKYPTYLTPIVFELGSLRNCLVHYDGELLHKDKGGHRFKETLYGTLRFLELDDSVEKLVILNKNDYINKVTFDLQTFIELCGGRIRRPIDHNLEILD